MAASVLIADLDAMHERICLYLCSNETPESRWSALMEIDAAICKALNGLRGGRL
jgi:hypothetical protein